VIHRNQIRVNVADFTVLGLHTREHKAVNQDGEALSARDGAERVRRLPGLAENLRALRVAGAVNVREVVRQSSGSREKRDCQQDEQTYARHRPLHRPGTRRALETILRLKEVASNGPKGQEFQKNTCTKRRGPF